MASVRRFPLMLSIVVITSVAFVASHPPETLISAEQTLSSAMEATVNRVIDGDSLDVHIDGRRVAVGYEDVETPDPGQPCGREARERNLQLVGNRVLLVEGPTEQFDGLGRRLYRAYAADGGSIAETLVREGLGRAVRSVSGADRLIAMEAEAQAAGLGCLWSASGGGVPSDS
jgi:endonuclease YncB( thermonuclease family)